MQANFNRNYINDNNYSNNIYNGMEIVVIFIIK